MSERARGRGLLAAVVVSCVLVSGGWLLTRNLSGTRAPAVDGARLLNQVIDRVSRLYVDTLSDSVLAVRAAEGLVDELDDPHSTYLSPELLARLSERTTGRYAGVGAQIDVRDGWITIIAPLPGGPALAAGIQAGDRIVSVDGRSLHGVVAEEAQKALRGPPGSRVQVTIQRPGLSAPIGFELTRREIRVQSVAHATLLGAGVGYTALTIFSEATVADLRRAIDSLRRAGMTSLILDLRGDPGGLLDQGVGVADLFLDAGQRVVTMKGRTSDVTFTLVDQAPQHWPDLPLAVLVDGTTASASEIVAGALQDHDRALILGATTYGKGSAQKVFPLSNGGALKLTTARWFTPSGRSIARAHGSADQEGADSSRWRPTYRTDAGRTVLGGGGITPDIVLRTPQPPAADTAFERMLGTRIPSFRDALTASALSLKASHAVTSPGFVVTPAMRASLEHGLRSRGVQVDPAVFAAARGLVDRLLGYEIARYVFGDQGEFARRLADDPMVQTAERLVAGARTQAELLSRGARAARELAMVRAASDR